MSGTGRTIRGVYRDGRVELAERPEGGAEEAPVLVTFLGAVESASPPATAGDATEAEAARRAAARRVLDRLERGISFGGPPYPSREELYDRFERDDEGAR